jgi:hypothetical protein
MQNDKKGGLFIGVVTGLSVFAVLSIIPNEYQSLWTAGLVGGCSAAFAGWLKRVIFK